MKKYRKLTVEEQEARLDLRYRCQHCGFVFEPNLTVYPSTRTQFCSRVCAQAFKRGPMGDATKRDKLRANGLINERVKRGIVKRSPNCVLCDKVCRTDAHHPDYTQPELIAWLCRSCHMKAHRYPEIEQAAATAARKVERTNNDRALAGGAA